MEKYRKYTKSVEEMKRYETNKNGNKMYSKQ